jgi:hypothetical protein
MAARLLLVLSVVCASACQCSKRDVEPVPPPAPVQVPAPVVSKGVGTLRLVPAKEPPVVEGSIDQGLWNFLPVAFEVSAGTHVVTFREGNGPVLLEKYVVQVEPNATTVVTFDAAAKAATTQQR